MPRRPLLPAVLAALLVLSTFATLTVAGVAPAQAAPPSLVETLTADFPSLAGSLRVQAETTPVTRQLAGRAVAGLAVTGGDPAPPATLGPRERQAWLAALERSAPVAAPPLAPFFPNRFTDPFTVEAAGLGVTLRPLGANAATVATEDGTIVYRDAYTQTDSLHAVGKTRGEEFLRLRSAAAPTRFDYEILATSGVTTIEMQAGGVRFAGKDGPALQIEAPWVVDATGQRQTTPVRWELGDPDASGVRRLTLALDPAGLTYPLVIDPSWQISTGNYPANVFTRRMEHTATLLNNGLVLVAGGRVSTADGLLGDASFTAELYNPANGTWATTGGMGQARFNHTATLLPNGKVLVVGGFNGVDNPIRRAELYSPDLGTWSSAGDTQVARERHTATLLKQNNASDPTDAYVLVAGGRAGNATALASAELYNVKTGVWSTTGSMADAREKHTATLLPDGRVLVAGGVQSSLDRDQFTGYLIQNTLNSAEIFNPSTGNWAQGAAMPDARQRHTATLVVTNRTSNTYGVLVVGGCNGDAMPTTPCTTALDTVVLYNVNTNTWNPVVAAPQRCLAAPTPTPVPSPQRQPCPRYSARGTTSNPPPPTDAGRYDHTATLLASGKVLIVGGRDSYCLDPLCTTDRKSESLNSAAIYDPVTGAWTDWVEDDMINSNEGTGARYAHTATLLPSGQVLIVSGFNKGGYAIPVPGSDGLLSDEMIYDPNEGFFTRTATNSTPPTTTTLLDPRRDHTATLLPNGKVLVAGGSSTDTEALSSAEIYDPASKTCWTSAGSMNTARYKHTATLLMDGTVLVAGGNVSQDGYTPTAEIYTPAPPSAPDSEPGIWSNTRSLALARARHTATLLPDGKVLVAGGFNDRDVVGNGNATGSAERYNPITRTWSSAGSLEPRWGHTATLLPNGLVLIAGGRGAGILNTAQLYNYATNGWSGAGRMVGFRQEHTATLLTSGQVLLTGGYGLLSGTNPADSTGPAASAELYFPNINRFLPTRFTWQPNNTPLPDANPGSGNMNDPRYGHTATLLPDSTVLVAGGFNNSGRLRSSETYDRGLGYDESWRPVITDNSVSLTIGGPMTVPGSKFRGIAETGDGAGASNASTNYPVLLVQSLASDQARYVPLDASKGWSDTVFTSQAIANFPPGYALVTIITNGIPSRSQFLNAELRPSGSPVWYFAEGYTGEGFDEFLTIQNPNTPASQVKITYYLTGASPITKTITVPGNSRYTVTVHDSREGVGRNKAVSAKVETTNDIGIIVERPMYFKYLGTIDGGHNVMGATAPQSAWYFAEGYTGEGFDQYLTIMNPNDAVAPVTINYYLEGGGTVVKTITVPANSRYTVAVHDEREGVGRNKAVSAKVESGVAGGIVVERPMYFRYGPGWTGGHNVMGAPAARKSWYFPEGNTTTNWDEYLTIMNTNATEAAVTLTYYVNGSSPQTKTIIVPARARYTVTVHDAREGVGRGKQVAAKVETTHPGGIVVERPMYFRAGSGATAVDGGHDVMGAPIPKANWYFAEGYTGAGFDEYIIVLNPNNSTAAVTLTYFLATGDPVVKTISVPANSRYNVVVHDTRDGVGRNQAVSAQVTTSHPGGVVAERPMYFTYTGAMGAVTGGHTVMGYAP